MSDAKLIRGQVRQVAKELLPELVTTAQYEELKKKIDIHLAELTKYVKNTLDIMETRQKDTLGYLVRSTSSVEKK